MKRNVCGFDQKIRIFAGVIILSLSIAGPKSVWGLVGLVPLITGLMGYCPLYSIIGQGSCSKEDKQE